MFASIRLRRILEQAAFHAEIRPFRPCGAGFSALAPDFQRARIFQQGPGQIPWVRAAGPGKPALAQGLLSNSPGLK